jgi:hypothetical protein
MFYIYIYIYNRTYVLNYFAWSYPHLEMGHWPSTRHIFDGYIGGATGGSPKDSGAESVGYIGGLTGGSPRDTGAESVGYIRGTDWRETQGHWG